MLIATKIILIKPQELFGSSSLEILRFSLNDNGLKKIIDLYMIQLHTYTLSNVE